MTEIDPREVAQARRREIRRQRGLFTFVLGLILLGLVTFWSDLFGQSPLSGFMLFALCLVLVGHYVWRRLTTSPGRFSSRGRDEGRAEGWYWW